MQTEGNNETFRVDEYICGVCVNIHGLKRAMGQVSISWDNHDLKYFIVVFTLGTLWRHE